MLSSESRSFWFVVGLLATFSSGGFAFERWNQANNPDNLDQNYVKDFSSLPTSGWVDRLPWADTYWPSVEGGLTKRWANPQSVPEFAKSVNSSSRLVELEKWYLDGLSPIEKFDIYLQNVYQGRSNYYFYTRSEVARTSRSNQGWEGVCNGWAAASIHHPEPKAIDVPVNIEVNGEVHQIKLGFWTSDLQALMSLYYYNQMEKNPNLYRVLGARCEGHSSSYVTTGSGRNRSVRKIMGVSTACEDTNAGAFHIALTNQIGIKKKSFIVDVSNDKSVWNQPVTGYKVNVLGQRRPSAGASSDAVSEFVVETTMYYVVESAPHYQPRGQSDDIWKSTQKGRRYSYTVELNAANQIVGGAWISAARPDFLWVMDKLPFEGDFKVLNDLMRPAADSAEAETN